MWHVATDRGDEMKARFVICASGILAKPKLAKIKVRDFKGHSFHTSRGTMPTKPTCRDWRTRWLVSSAPGRRRCRRCRVGAAAKELYVFQRTPSSMDSDDWPTIQLGAQAAVPDGRRTRTRAEWNRRLTAEQKAERAASRPRRRSVGRKTRTSKR